MYGNSVNTRTLYIDTMRESLEVNLTKAANKEKEVETHNNNNEYIIALE